MTNEPHRYSEKNKQDMIEFLLKRNENFISMLLDNNNDGKNSLLIKLVASGITETFFKCVLEHVGKNTVFQNDGEDALAVMGCIGRFFGLLSYDTASLIDTAGSDNVQKILLDYCLQSTHLTDEGWEKMKKSKADGEAVLRNHNIEQRNLT